MILSSACQNIIRAIIYLNNKDDFTLIKTISEDLNIPLQFLSKNMQVATKHGFILTKRGANGGIKLAQKPSDIKIMDIIKLVDGDKYFDECILGISLCEAETPCALHEEWSKRKDELVEILSATTLEDIAKDLQYSKILRIWFFNCLNFNQYMS